MEVACKHYKGKDLLRINAVRLYLQVFYISDISSSCGTIFDKSFLHPTGIRLRQSLLHWPKQELPGAQAWTIWRQMLKRYFSTHTYVLRQRLGDWTTDTPRTQFWLTQYSETTKSVYIKKPTAGINIDF